MSIFPPHPQSNAKLKAVVLGRSRGFFRVYQHIPKDTNLRYHVSNEVNTQNNANHLNDLSASNRVGGIDKKMHSTTASPDFIRSLPTLKHVLSKRYLGLPDKTIE
jgi:hypothetical protein